MMSTRVKRFKSATKHRNRKLKVNTKKAQKLQTDVTNRRETK